MRSKDISLPNAPSRRSLDSKSCSKTTQAPCSLADVRTWEAIPLSSLSIKASDLGQQRTSSPSLQVLKNLTGLDMKSSPERS